MKFICRLLLSCFVFLFPFSAAAQVFSLSHRIDLQDTTQVHVILTARGDRLIGKITKISNTGIQFRLSGLPEETAFAFYELRFAGIIGEGMESGDDNFVLNKTKVADNPASGHESLIYNGTAFPFKKGRGEFRTVDLLYNIVDVGLSDHFSIGGGFLLPVALLARFKGAFPVSESVNFGLVSNFIFPIFTGFDGEIINHTYAVTTIGRPTAFFNFGFGYTSDFGPFANVSPMVSFGGSVVLGEGVRINVDGLWATDEGSTGIVPGIELAFFRPKSRFSFGTIAIPDSSFPLFPLLSYARRL